MKLSVKERLEWTGHEIYIHFGFNLRKFIISQNKN